MAYHTTTVNFHGAASLTADAGSTSGAPLNIEVLDADGLRAGGITIFVGDKALANRLADAINAACQPVKIDEAA